MKATQPESYEPRVYHEYQRMQVSLTNIKTFLQSFIEDIPELQLDELYNILDYERHRREEESYNPSLVETEEYIKEDEI